MFAIESSVSVVWLWLVGVGLSGWLGRPGSENAWVCEIPVHVSSAPPCIGIGIGLGGGSERPSAGEEEGAREPREHHSDFSESVSHSTACPLPSFPPTGSHSPAARYSHALQCIICAHSCSQLRVFHHIQASLSHTVVQVTSQPSLHADVGRMDRMMDLDLSHCSIVL